MSWKGDPNAIHLVVDGEIDGLTEKATPVDADLVVIEDSADSNSKKKAQLGNLPGGGGSSDAGDPFINYPHKPYPVSGDPTVGTRITMPNAGGGDHDAFPGVCLWGDELVCLVRSAGAHAVATGASRGTLYMSRSANLGRTWSDFSEVLDDGTEDYRDPCLTTLSDGRIVASFMRNDGSSVDTLVSFSSDGGLTFGTPVVVVSNLAVSAPVVELANGNLLLPVYGGAGEDAFLYQSTDDGVTWSLLATIEDDAGGNWTEPYVQLLASGDLLCLIREDDNRDIWASTSSDSGATWSASTNEFPGWGRPSFVQFDSETITVVYRKDDSSGGSVDQHAVGRTSRDDGATWGDEFTFDDTRRSAYAQPVEVSGGQAAVVYALEDGSITESALYFRYLIDGDGITAVGDDTLALESASIDDLTDVDTTTTAPTTGDVLEWDGSNWVPAEPSGGSGGSEILISDTPSTPLVFADLLQNEDQDDLIYAD